ncbi:MAG: hypothetical protein GXP34_02310 [Actinobacteria bacterium]|nr:hypothetical protein [Actinomycetota bacterium]
MAVITVWSDMLCPWGYVAGLRLRKMRDQLGADSVSFDFRAWPLDVTHRPPTTSRRRAEIVALAQREPSAFTLYEGAIPVSSVLASEAQKWGYSYGQEVGEHFDLAIRRSFFLHSRNLGIRDELLAVAQTEGLDDGALASALDSGEFRPAITADIREGREIPVGASPTVVLPDGTVLSNPGFEVTRLREIPIITADHPSIYEDLLQRATWQD